MRAVFLAAAAVLLAGCRAPTPAARPAWVELFDGRSMGAFESTRFGGEGDVSVDGGALALDFGSPLTGVTWTGPLPAAPYEIEVTARRVDGTDFFCCLTFPVGSEHCSLVLGGWGGTVCGISCIDGIDAAENETRRVVAFRRGRDYVARVRVGDERVTAWLDGEVLVAVERAGRTFAVRPEVALSRPLGVATYATRALVRRVRIRELDGADPATR